MMLQACIKVFLASAQLERSELCLEIMETPAFLSMHKVSFILKRAHEKIRREIAEYGSHFAKARA